MPAAYTASGITSGVLDRTALIPKILALQPRNVVQHARPRLAGLTDDFGHEIEERLKLGTRGLRFLAIGIDGARRRRDIPRPNHPTNGVFQQLAIIDLPQMT